MNYSDLRLSSVSKLRVRIVHLGHGDFGRAVTGPRAASVFVACTVRIVTLVRIALSVAEPDGIDRIHGRLLP